MPLLPLLANSFGWIFTEMGRQPWIVFGEMLTRDGVSRSVSLAEVLTSLHRLHPASTPPSPSSRSSCCCATPRPACPTSPRRPTDDDTDDAERPLAFAY